MGYAPPAATSDAHPATPGPRLSVCIVTYERPSFLRRCLLSVARQAEEIHQVVVVDASKAGNASLVRSAFPDAVYIHAPKLAGWMTRSRNVALMRVTGDVVAFIDDDVVLRDGWARNLRDAFTDPRVAAVAGRTCNGIAGEEQYALPIGRFYPDGSLTEGFASDPAAPVAVDHGIGANMAFRRDVLATLGGLRDDYPGTALREDTDVFLRVKALGLTTVFVPDAAVDHRPAPHVRGARFDTRYKIYGRRNHIVLLARHAGVGSPTLWRWIAAQFRAIAATSGARVRLLRLGVTVIGVSWGLAALPGTARWRPLSAPREDALGRALRARLSEGGRECD